MMILISGQIHSQISGVYYLAINKQDCYITIFNNGKYYIDINESVTSDIILGMTLTYGTYTINKDQITLTDNMHNFKMKFLYVNNSIEVKQSFKFLLNKKFVFREANNESEPDFLINRVDIVKIKKERIEYNKTNSIPIVFNIGTYDDGRDFVLYLEKDTTYRLAYRWNIISEGNWSRDGNVLELFDTSLQCPFYLFIDISGLNGKYLPGGFDGLELKRNK